MCRNQCNWSSGIPVVMFVNQDSSSIEQMEQHIVDSSVHVTLSIRVVEGQLRYQLSSELTHSPAPASKPCTMTILKWYQDHGRSMQAIRQHFQVFGGRGNKSMGIPRQEKFLSR
jgi:hypothetical protein